MPFDALVAPVRPKSLADVLDEQHVTTVQWAVLAAHKEAQLRRFAPGFWHQHQTLLPVGLLGSVGCMAASGGLAHGLMPVGAMFPSFLTLLWLCVMTMLIVFGVFRANAGSRWEERWVTAHWLEALGVPAPIAATARLLHRELPGSALILGELLQEEVLLDPYLLLEHNGQSICLGIWDGRRIIATAASHSDTE
jgi:hypothetical protein